MSTQIIRTGNGYEAVSACTDPAIEVAPSWPIMDEGGSWHHEAFPGQAVLFDRAHVDFGFLADELPISQAPVDSDGELNLDGLYLTETGRLYREA